MGKWTSVKYDDETARKTRVMFNHVEERLRKDHPDNPFSFENFVEALDENDPETRKWFEILVRETYKRSNRHNVAPYSSPPPLSHRSFRSRSTMSSSPFLQPFGSVTSSSDLSNGDNDSDNDYMDPIVAIALERDLRERERDRLPLPANFVERAVRRTTSRVGISPELLELSDFAYNSSHVRSQPQSVGLPPPSGPSHMIERLRELRERDRDSTRRAGTRLRIHGPVSSPTNLSAGASSSNSSSSSDRAPSPNPAFVAVLAAAAAQRRESAPSAIGASSDANAILPVPEFQSYRRPPPPTLSPPAPIPDHPPSPSSRLVVRRGGPEQRTDLRHYMREIDSMYLEHRDRSDRFERTLERERDRYREARLEDLDRTGTAGVERQRERSAVRQDVEREIDEIEDRIRRGRMPTGIPTPPHAANVEEDTAAAGGGA